MSTKEIKTLNISETGYPKLLRKITNPPKILYVRGDLLPDERCFAVVGTRLCSPYGKQATMEITSDLAKAGLTIVSGLAPGIDTFAHKATLEAKGRTIAVLGTGIDEKSLYPSENIQLARQIVESGGAVISEYPPGTPGSKITFPHRNRIISGLSLGVLVVEAKEKSGALITAEYAKKQGRKIFAMPGSIYSLNSRGTHKLIKCGALLAENANDILKALKLNLLEFDSYRSAAESKEEELILKTLAEGPLDIESIIEKTGLSAATTAGTLSVMELQRKIRNLGQNIYGLNR